MTEKPALTAIIGPTASGKTDYALRLASQKNGAVISADSRQVYRGMDIGTAKVRDTRGVPHYLMDIREPSESLSLSEWQQLAFEAIDSILSNGKHPILAGGTMLYIDSIVYNFDIPRVQPDLAFRERKEKIENRKLYEELLQKDPKAKNFIEPTNARRIIRALEVVAATGKRFSAQRKRRTPRYKTEIIGLFPGWDELRRRIEVRAQKMFDNGLLEEIAALREKYGKDLPLFQTLNYRQTVAVLDGIMPKDEAVKSMVRDNLRYAHRQMSWWKGRSDIQWKAT